MLTRTTRRWRRPTRRAGLVGVTIILATITACTSQPEAGSPPSTRLLERSSRPSLGVSAAEVAGRKAVESYTAMWMAVATAAETGDWQSPRLSQHATGTALTTLSRSIYLDHTKGWVGRGRPTLSPTITSVEPPNAPTRVRIADCGDSTNWLRYDATTGQPIDSVPGGRRAITAVVDRQDDGAWLVSDFVVKQVGSC